MGLLQSPLWTVLGVLATIILGFVGICTTLWIRNRKALTYEVVSDIPIVAIRRNSGGDMPEGIEIRYKGQPVTEVRVVEVRLCNAGNVEINKADFIKPITLDFGGQLLGFEAREEQPGELRQEVLEGAGSGPDHSAIGLHAILLNPKDAVTVQAVLTNFSGVVQVRARIVGISSIRRLSRSQFSRVRAGWATATGTLGFLFAVTSFFFPFGVRIAAGLLGGALIGAAAVYLWPYVKAWRAKHLW